MPTPAERRALLFFASVALLGAGWRTVRATGAVSPTDGERAALDHQIAAVDSARVAPARGKRASRSDRGRGSPPARSPAEGAGQRLIDVDRAGADELEGLPRIGPTLARRIIADRDSFGAFGSLEALQRVKGIGPAMAREIASRITFSAPTAARIDAHRARAPPVTQRDSTGRRPPVLWSGGPPRE